MTPLPSVSAASATATKTNFTDQWVNPGDAFNVLLILGGNIVGQALAQLAGHGIPPVAFSFGWVGYSVSALLSAVGENKLLPSTPDCRCKLINGKTGHAIENSSWIMGRLVRDFPSWNHMSTVKKTTEVLDARWKELLAEDPNAKRPDRASLIVTIYEPSTEHPAGVPQRDYLYWSGIFTSILQLGIAAIPFGLFGDWGVLMVTACGISLAFITACLPQWRKEKWACRRHSNDSYTITRGNGAQHAIAILGNGHGLNLEDLGAGQTNMNVSANRLTKISVVGLFIIWVLLLITASGLRTNTWFLLAVGGIGILQNVFVAGCSRRPENFGIPLRFIAVFGRTKVMRTLLDVERRFPMLGRSMQGEFFPGGLSESEIKEWHELDARKKTKGGI
ncbi:uncharacterized protein PAC_18498 [Phialocephala subalpina]|uniref:Uncharacterized protein n=1 Tax=Phialocephala subalpina TaxID=576137 RepID=A0A1L7XU95_9HELO|nr:uncharacterized protein PAC_18498 [Phialocephala subalpina]